MPELLFLSNGHGEDAIAHRIIHQLQQLPNPPEIAALPIVGTGYAYQAAQIPIIGNVQAMPSGGFIYMDSKQLVRDVQGGLIQLTRSQISAIRQWVRQHPQGSIVAVGDIVPLSFAWLSGTNYALIGTAKSEYYIRDDSGMLPGKPRGAWWAKTLGGSIYHPWERWFMHQPRCQAVFPRDSLTTEILQKFSIPAFNLGNPMMDDLETSPSSARFYPTNVEQQELGRALVVTLLPGSRPPEAYQNWEIIMSAVAGIINTFRDKTLVFLGAIAPGLDLDTLTHTLTSQSWQPTTKLPITTADPQALLFKQNQAFLALTHHAFNDCLQQADIAIAMAGTATEQFIGLGKPAITIPGSGPQFNPTFAESQSRHLGISVLMVQQPTQVAKVIQTLFQDPDRLQAIADNGIKRMGKPGAAQRIAKCLVEKLGSS